MMEKKVTKPAEKIFNRFVEGDISIEDYTAHINASKVSKTTRGHKRANNMGNKTTHIPNKRLSEFFANKSK